MTRPSLFQCSPNVISGRYLVADFVLNIMLAVWLMLFNKRKKRTNYNEIIIDILRNVLRLILFFSIMSDTVL